MMEDDFPGFQKLYRQLRKEGVPFPQRDPNLRMLMSNICSDSPMFDYVEQIAGRAVKSSVPIKEEAKQIQHKKREKPQEETKELSIDDEMIDKQFAMHSNSQESQHTLANLRLDQAEVSFYINLTSYRTIF